MIGQFTEKQDVVFENGFGANPVRASIWRSTWSAESRIDLSEVEATHYGFVTEAAYIHANGSRWRLGPGMHFSAVGGLTICGGAGLVVSRLGYRGLFSIGGPIEKAGRLRYIDGCSDTLLIGPPRMGDPCLNHLHFPPGIRQTMHTHPSIRVGIVAAGKGRCVTPEGEFPLVPGVGWFLPVDGQHCFHTDGESMDVIAWHPDSDTGPTDDDHPMLNRTYVDGVSAAGIDAIRTKGNIRE